MIKYGKKYSDVGFRTDFLVSENDAFKSQNKKYFDVYRQQAKRNNCKICGHLFKDDSYLVTNDIKYYICQKCGHLNGEYEDTNEFCNYLYNSTQGGEITLNYLIKKQLMILISVQIRFLHQKCLFYLRRSQSKNLFHSN